MQSNKLTRDIIDNKDYVCSLTTSLNDVEKNYLKLAKEYEEHKICKENTISTLKNKLNASEEIVQQLLPGNLFYYICKY